MRRATICDKIVYRIRDEAWDHVWYALDEDVCDQVDDETCVPIDDLLEELLEPVILELEEL